jgi:hypothetical protein
VQFDRLPVFAQVMMARPEVGQVDVLVRAITDGAVGGQAPGEQVDRLPVLAQALVADPQVGHVVGVQAGVGNAAMDAPVHLDQGAVVTPQPQVVEVDIVEHGGGGVVVAGVAAQLELGQLRPEVFQGAPGPARRPDLGVVVRRPGLQGG